VSYYNTIYILKGYQYSAMFGNLNPTVEAIQNLRECLDVYIHEN